MVNSKVHSFKISNAPRVTFETIDLAAFSGNTLEFENLGLTDASLRTLPRWGPRSLSIVDCPVSDTAIIEYLKSTTNLRYLKLGQRKLSHELIHQIITYTAANHLNLTLEDVDDQTLDLFLATPQNQLELDINVDWTKEKADIYKMKFKGASMSLKFKAHPTSA